MTELTAPRSFTAGAEPSPDHPAPHQAAPLGEPPKMPSRWMFLPAFLVMAGLLAWGIDGHWQKNQAAAATQQQIADMVPTIRVTTALVQDGPVDLTLPGETQAFDSASIFARATGYISDRRVDIGSRVRKGDLLIHIAAPDLDQQLAQAQAQLEQVKAALQQSNALVNQAEANLNLAKVTFARTNTLVGQGYETLQNRDTQQANVTSQQANVDTAKAGVKLAQANVDAQQASIDRLKALTAFEDVRAPFDGVVTARNVDTGDLVNADSSAGSPMFTVVKDDVLRVMVQVPQNSAIGVRDGLDAKIHVPQLPDRTFEGKVTRSSVALISSARTLTAEVDVPNADGLLRSGLYVYVSFAIPRTHPDVVVPSETLMFNQDGMQVAMLGPDDKIKLTPVKIYRDLGSSVDLSEGLRGGERIVVSPPATLQNGSKVRVDPGDQPRSRPSQQVSEK